MVTIFSAGFQVLKLLSVSVAFLGRFDLPLLSTAASTFGPILSSTSSCFRSSSSWTHLNDETSS